MNESDPSSPHWHWHWRLLALALLLLFAFAFQGTRGLWSPDEGRYTQVALEMLGSGDFIHPRLHSEHPHYSKPPLTYWAIAASIDTLGHNEWAVRLPHALAFVLTVLLLFGLGRELVPLRPWLPPLIYLSMLLPYIAANSVTTDTPLALCTTLYAFAFVRARRLEPGAARRNVVLLLWLGAGFAFMVKGPPGLLPLAGLLLCAYGEALRPPVRSYFSVPGLLLFALGAFPWFAKGALDRPEVAPSFLGEEVGTRGAPGT